MSKAAVKNFAIMVGAVVVAGYAMNQFSNVKLIGDARRGFGN
ncbi:MAG: hypothetical protein OXR68_00220 [Alphaproteobacteria bacterium]|nr:hypothetical protein [Alphaproteobacteria bacterium]MDD9919036.1 hypothetical protein [Alphaproteobacteria bacterium]